MAFKVFIDGKEGTTGLRIYERLADREDIELLTLPEEQRKLPEARKACLHAADVSILCLPDAAARESVSLAAESKTKILDTSTAHRIAPNWSYGFPELSKEHRDSVIHGNRVAVPGCHASGFISLVSPLVASGIIDKTAQLTCFSITGYSGGGKKMIAQYEAEDREAELSSPRQYGLKQTHKHLPEMKVQCTLNEAPVFCPIVADFYSGMEVTVPLFSTQVNGRSRMEVLESLQAHYAGSKVVRVLTDEQSESLGGFAASNTYSFRDCMELSVAGNDDRMLLIARYDNLGKGASGAALQCLNLMIGAEETCGMVL